MDIACCLLANAKRIECKLLTNQMRCKSVRIRSLAQNRHCFQTNAWCCWWWWWWWWLAAKELNSQKAGVGSYLTTNLITCWLCPGFDFGHRKAKSPHNARMFVVKMIVKMLANDVWSLALAFENKKIKEKTKLSLQKRALHFWSFK